MKQRLWHIVDQAPPGSPVERASRMFDWMIIGLILLNAVAFIVSTVESIGTAYAGLFNTIEAVSVTVFVLEYAARLALCTQHPGFRRPVTGRLRYALRPMMIIDLLAILPALLPFVGVDLRTLRLLRLMRLARIVKLGRYSTAIQSIGRVFVSRREELAVTVGLMLVLIVIAASAMYFAENEAQPQHFSSVPASFWWAVATLTTVGYGDVYPITALGKVIGGIIALLGVGLVAMPTGILAAGFSEEMHRARAERRKAEGGASVSSTTQQEP